MSLLRIDPSIDNIVKVDGTLEEGRYPYLITVAWEYDQERYLVWSERPDAIKIDFAPLVRKLRDEGFVIFDVTAL